MLTPTRRWPSAFDPDQFIVVPNLPRGINWYRINPPEPRCPRCGGTFIKAPSFDNPNSCECIACGRTADHKEPSSEAYITDKDTSHQEHLPRDGTVNPELYTDTIPPDSYVTSTCQKILGISNAFPKVAEKFLTVTGVVKDRNQFPTTVYYSKASVDVLLDRAIAWASNFSEKSRCLPFIMTIEDAATFLHISRAHVRAICCPSKGEILKRSYLPNGDCGVLGLSVRAYAEARYDPKRRIYPFLWPSITGIARDSRNA